MTAGIQHNVWARHHNGEFWQTLRKLHFQRESLNFTFLEIFFSEDIIIVSRRVNNYNRFLLSITQYVI